jgi:prepilin-type N-terminal cleavage/methylation domain-containing protein
LSKLASPLLIGHPAVAAGEIVSENCNHHNPACCVVHAVTEQYRKQEATNMKIQNDKKSGFTLVEIMIVVAIIGLLAAIAIPNFVKARTTSQQNACINNLRQIDGAVQQWALETKQSSGASVSLGQVKPYIKLDSTGNIPSCPAGGAYTVSTVNSNPTCNVSGHALP